MASSKNDEGGDERITSGREKTEGVEERGKETEAVTGEARKEYYGV